MGLFSALENYQFWRFLACLYCRLPQRVPTLLMAINRGFIARKKPK
jgi:hypothetical protein